MGRLRGLGLSLEAGRKQPGSKTLPRNRHFAGAKLQRLTTPSPSLALYDGTIYQHYSQRRSTIVSAAPSTIVSASSIETLNSKNKSVPDPY